MGVTRSKQSGSSGKLPIDKREIILHRSFKMSLNIFDSSVFPDHLGGMKLWGSNIILARYVILNSKMFNNQRVLDFFAGVGIVGITVKKWTKAKIISFSDTYNQILYNIEQNWNSNVD